MSLGHVMLDLQGVELNAEEVELLEHPQVGGVILFSRNYESPSQLTHLVKSIRKTTSKRLLLAVDQEGGRIQRFKTGFTELPSMRLLGELHDSTPEQAIYRSETLGRLMAEELLSYDLDFSFAPVLDLDRGISEVIGNRAFHADPHIVTKLAGAFCKGMRAAGMAAVGKHFPGHGSVALDSHVAVPVDNREYAEIAGFDLIPFQQLASTLDGIMPAHVIYPKMDPQPACFSKFWLENILRKQLKFSGAIFSDDLGMAGAEVAGNFIQRAHAALSAGCDMILICNNRAAAVTVIDALGYNTDLISQQRLLKMLARN